jgi:hypothetical protein
MSAQRDHRSFEIGIANAGKGQQQASRIKWGYVHDRNDTEISPSGPTKPETFCPQGGALNIYFARAAWDA